MIKTRHIVISVFVVAIAIPVSFMAQAMKSDKPIVESALMATPAIAPIVLVPEKPVVLAKSTVKKPVVKKPVAKKKVVKKKATKKKEKLTLQPALITPETAPHSPKKR